MMNPFEMVVLIVAIASFTAVLKAGFRARRRPRGEAGSADFDDADTAMLVDEVRRLRDRVGVLERIVTDRSADLAVEIEQLRDAPRA